MRRLFALLLLSLSIGVQAQEFPSKPIRIIVPFVAGGAVDFVARTIGAVAAEGFRQPVIIENRPGASTMLGATACARAVPDGYTVCMTGAEAMSYAKHLFTSVPYDAENDFIGITNLLFTSGVIFTSPGAPFNRFADLINYARAHPAKLNYATWGTSSIPDLLRLSFEQRFGVRFTPIPYKGGAPANQAVLSGEADLTYFATGLLIPQFQAGKLRPLALTTRVRTEALPEVPTLLELGADAGIKSYMGLYTAAKTPPAVVERLNQEFVRALRAPKVEDQLRRQHMELVGNSIAEFNQFLKEDRELAARVFQSLGVKAQAAPN